MNRKLLSLVFGASFLSLSAGAVDIPGFATVNNTNTSITAQFNVAINPQAGHANSYIWTNGYANNSVGIGGYDAVNNRSFLCYVSTADALYNAAVDIRNGAGPYTYIRVVKSTSSNACTSIFVLKDSRRNY